METFDSQLFEKSGSGVIVQSPQSLQVGGEEAGIEPVAVSQQRGGDMLEVGGHAGVDRHPVQALQQLLQGEISVISTLLYPQCTLHT